jgi:hypothetical protein
MQVQVADLDVEHIDGLHVHHVQPVLDVQALEPGAKPQG